MKLFQKEILFQFFISTYYFCFCSRQGVFCTFKVFCLSIQSIRTQLVWLKLDLIRFGFVFSRPIRLLVLARSEANISKSTCFLSQSNALCFGKKNGQNMKRRRFLESSNLNLKYNQFRTKNTQTKINAKSGQERLPNQTMLENFDNFQKDLKTINSI